MIEDALVCIVDDDADLGAALVRFFGRQGYRSIAFQNPLAMLAAIPEAGALCVVSDIMMGDVDGFHFAEQLRAADPSAAVVFMTAWPTTSAAVDAIRRFGGIDYLEKPVDEERLALAVEEGLIWSAPRRAGMARLRLLTPRERQVFDLIVLGKSNKVVAAELGLSPKTVEVHRAAIMAKTQASCLADLIALGG